MKIFTNSITEGYFGDQFGSRGTQFFKDDKPNRSFHLAWKDLPKNTQALAVVFIDHDAIPVCGFSWLHWSVANIDPGLGELSENSSVEKSLLEGVTSWNSGILPEAWQLNREEATGYRGCAPPDKEHKYTVDVYALDRNLNLSRGFYLNELLNDMHGHVLDQASLHGLYKTK